MKIEINIDDKLISKVRRFFSRRNVIVIFVFIFMMSIVLYAADLRLNVFKPKTVILSSEINSNFAAIKEKIDANYKEIDAKINTNYAEINTKISANSAAIGANSTAISANSATIKSNYNHLLELIPPVGSIVVFAGPSNNLPSGWLVCDGRKLNKDTYKTLFDVIGFSWGWDNENEFYLPDMPGWFPTGVYGGTAYYIIRAK